MTDDKITSFEDAKSRKRHKSAETADDCRKWTPLDALKKAVADIEAGELNPNMVYVAFYEREPDTQMATYNHYCAGGRTIELTGLLAQHLRQITD